MARDVFAFLPTGPEPLECLYVPATGEHLTLGNIAEGDRVTLFVPGPDVAIHTITLPAKSDREARKAAPYAIEDEIADGVEAAHVALGPYAATGRAARALHLVSKAKMATWIAWADAAGLGRARFVAEQSVLPEGVALALPGRILARRAETPLALDVGLPEELKTALLGDLSVSDLSEVEALTQLADWLVSSQGVVDLRQGAYRARSPRTAKSLQAWRLSGALAAAVAATWLGAGWLEVRAMRTSAADLRAEAAALYTRAFPGAPAGDPVRALARRNPGASARPDMNFLHASAVLYGALGDVEGASLRSLRFDPRRGGLVASVGYRDYGDDAALKQAIEQAGYRVRVGDARQTDGRVVGDVTMEGSAR